MKKNALRYVVSAAISLAAVYAVVMSTGCSSSSDEQPPPATKTIYTGTIYMASTGGGHIVKVPVTIDPSSTTAPITLTASPTRLVQLSDGTGAANKTHDFHDVRLDGNKLYYSAIKVDSTATADAGYVHLGYVDLANANTKHDMLLDATSEAQAGMVYCGSGQSANYYIPMTMSYPAYIDVIPKSAMLAGTALSSTDNVKRTLIDSFRADGNYVFAHGVNNINRDKLFVTVNETNADGTGKGTLGGRIGSVTAYLLDMAKLEDPDLAVTASAVTKSKTISGLSAAGTVAFRSAFTPDGMKILQAGRDRLLVLDSATLDPVVNDTTIGGANFSIENHDVMPTPDGKYAILALRYAHASTEMQDSGLQLYDLVNKKPVGEPVSTCSNCHSSATVAHMTCGLDGSLAPSTVNQ